MICLCGYAHEYYEGESEDNEKFVGKRIGKNKFLLISGNFVLESYYERPDYNGSFDKEVSLYACPECNTIQLKD